jgi:hypothetical protein
MRLGSEREMVLERKHRQRLVGVTSARWPTTTRGQFGKAIAAINLAGSGLVRHNAS